MDKQKIQISINLDAELVDRLRALKRDCGTPMVWVIEAALRAWFARKP